MVFSCRNKNWSGPDLSVKMNVLITIEKEYFTEFKDRS